MSKLDKRDFYYGAFLSALLNKSNAKPSLFDVPETDSRRVYKFATNNTAEDDHIIYTKYVTGNEKEAFGTWTFQFSDSEIATIQELHSTYKNIFIALICAKDNLTGSELALLTYAQAHDCLGIGKGIKGYRINIKSIKNRKGLFAYGSGRVDKQNEKDNYINISRDSLSQL